MINAGKPMTNEEAVKILKNLMAMKNISFLHFSQRLAVGMAIEALKEKSGNCLIDWPKEEEE